MSEKKTNRIIAAGVFVTSLIVYLVTLSPTVVFWDVGEYLASAYLLQVPHPPGAPLLLLVGHVVSMIPFAGDIAFRMHTISALSGAIVVTFLYLICVKLIKRFRGKPETSADNLLMYGASVVAALTLAFSASFWNNSIEFEAKGTAMFFVAVILWLALRWSERADKPRNEQYLFLIAYIMGLCVGVRPLALLTVFPVGLIIYYTKYEFSRPSFIRFMLVTFAIFVGIYPGIVKWFPSMMAGSLGGINSDLLPFVPPLLVAVAAYYAFTAAKAGQRAVYITCVSFLLIVLGYSTYTSVLIRANAKDLPINENDPSTVARLYTYLNREQYGDSPVFQRRYSQEPMHAQTWRDYSSDFDFLVRYQINHMYIRYLLRNFIGGAGDEQDAGISWTGTLGIPFFLGLLGLYYHFRKDRSMAFAFLATFLLLGVIFALYQNQQQPQPRERDYFYVGSYFVFSLWIGLGVFALTEALMKKTARENIVAAGCCALAAIIVPGNLVRINWFSHDRSKNYVAWDYSYNILQTCERDAILFTNGDNDTFPLWYLQDVAGVRRDVRIVNLSLVNTSWYILQLKNNQPHGAKKVPISLTDSQIDRIQPVQWDSHQMELPVSKEVWAKFGVDDTALVHKGKIVFTMPPTLQVGSVKAIKTQDIMVWDIIRTNNWERPVYFAVTVSPDSKIGLDDYMWMDGLAWRLKPVKAPAGDVGLEADILSKNIMTEHVVPSKEPQYGYLYRGLNDSSIYFDENIRRMTLNYRYSYLRLAMYYQSTARNVELGKAVLARMETVLPRGVIQMDYAVMANVMMLYDGFGEQGKYEEYATELEQISRQMIAAGNADVQSYYSPYRVLLDIYEHRRDYKKAIGVLDDVAAMYPNDPGIKSKRREYERLLGASDHADTVRR